jgi:DnaK suppressor protein
VDDKRTRELLDAERTRVQALLADAAKAGQADRSAENEPGDREDRAEPLTAEGTNDAVVAGLQSRLEALHRAEERLAAGTYGLSVLSGRPIPDDRLEADPAAELTVDEANRR